MIKKTFWMIMLMCCVGAVGAQVLRVGDLVTVQDGTQGIVYYLNPDGSGGWLVSLFDASVGDCPWGTSSNVPDLADQDPAYPQQLLLDTTGYANTQKIRAHYNDNLPYAAGVVDFEHGWVLPSPAQLQMLYVQLPYISSAIVAAGGRDLHKYPYWSSAEAGDYYAWALDFGYNEYSGYLFKSSKYNTYRVRAVRSFTYPLYLWNTNEGSPSIVVFPNQTDEYSVTVRTGYGTVGSAETTIATKSKVDTVIVETACESYTWNGVTYTQSGAHTVHYSAANGCDSAVTLMLTINYAPAVSVSTTAEPGCPGDSVTLQATGNAVFSLPAVAAGDILCTDGSIEKPATFLSSGKTAMGIVFQVDPSGQHGWAVHLQDQAMEIIWGGYDLEIPGLPQYPYIDYVLRDTSGYSNTATIRAAGGASVFPAAYAVDFIHGWYLPADGQLSALFAELINVNASLQQVGGTLIPIPLEDDFFHYWSSTVRHRLQAWYMDASGGTNATYKHYTARVRAVRSF